MLTDCAVALSTSPICSAICMKRLLKISSRAGCGAVAGARSPSICHAIRFQQQLATAEALRPPACFQHQR